MGACLPCACNVLCMWYHGVMLVELEHLAGSTQSLFGLLETFSPSSYQYFLRMGALRKAWHALGVQHTCKRSAAKMACLVSLKALKEHKLITWLCCIHLVVRKTGFYASFQCQEGVPWLLKARFTTQLLCGPTNDRNAPICANAGASAGFAVAPASLPSYVALENDRGLYGIGAATVLLDG
jgi:hypothetical protein